MVLDYSSAFIQAISGRQVTSPTLDTEGVWGRLDERCHRITESLEQFTHDELVRQCVADISESASLLSARRESLRIALVGRTMSGKSTLFEALTGGDGSLMGRGGQRTTRKATERPLLATPGCVLLDTPGVGARDGAEDKEIAMRVARESDIVLWVFANDSTQQQTAEALIELAELGKPLILFMNCREKIASPQRRRRFLREPSRSYRDNNGHWQRLMRYLEPSGVVPVGEVAGHALGAFLGLAEEDRDLYQASNVQQLVDLLEEEVRVKGEHRKLIGAYDSIRIQMQDWSDVLIANMDFARAEEKVLFAQAAEIESRLDRVTQEVKTSGQNQLGTIFDSARTWYTHADLSKDVASQWETELQRIQAEAEDLLGRLDRELVDAVASEVEAFVDDWEVPEGGLRFSGTIENSKLSGKANRLVKLAARVGPGAAAVMFIATGPPGWAAGAAAGAATVTSLVLNRFAANPGGWIDRALPGRRKKQDEYRKKLSEATKRDLDELAEQTLTGWSDRIEAIRAGWGNNVAAIRDVACSHQHMVEVRCAADEEIRTQMRGLDHELAKSMLLLSLRPQAAKVLRGVQRVPGIGMVLELPEPQRSEIALVPPVALCEPVITNSTPDHPYSRWWSTASIVFGAGTPPFSLHEGNPVRLVMGGVGPGWTARGVERLAEAFGDAPFEMQLKGQL